MSEGALHALAEAKGILPVFHDLGGTAHWTNDDTRRAMLRAIGVEAGTDADAQAALEAHHAEQAGRIVPSEYVVTAGKAALIPVTRPCDWAVFDEAGQQVAAGFAEHHVALPALGVGVHQLRIKADGTEQSALVPAAPETTPMLAARIGQDRVWGVTAPLYGLRSARNLGLGDFADLAALAHGLGKAGASFLGINPIHSWGWACPEIASPYSPSHRGFLNTIHIAMDRIPGLEDCTGARELVGKAQAEVDRSASDIDYGALAKTQMPLLRSLYDLFRTNASDEAQERLDRFTRSSGDDLRLFAIYEVLSTKHGANWHLWPEAMQNPATLPTDGFDSRELDFHIWLQWVAQEQLHSASKASSMPLGLYLDLAVGARRDGAEAWMGQDSVAKGVALGAPPDHLSPEGQNWQLTAFAPSLSAANNYRNFRNVLQQAMRSAGVLRIDHVLGLNRSFWIPDDGSPGAYIRQPFETLLALASIEAHRANCVVVGEDLGLVPDGFRETLAAHGLYGYSVLQYEKNGDGSFRDPAQLRVQSLACFATHDTPTLHGFCAGRDIEWWQRLGWIDEPKAEWLRGERHAEVAALVPNGNSPGHAIHDRLAGSPVAMAAVQLDDVFEEVEAQNLPGTIDEHPNWRRICGVAMEDLDQSPALNDLTDLMRNSGRAHSHPEGEN